MDFLGIGPLELILVLVLGFLFFGPDKLPNFALRAGKLYQSFRKATSDLGKTITADVAAELKSDINTKKSQPGTVDNKDIASSVDDSSIDTEPSVKTNE